MKHRYLWRSLTVIFVAVICGCLSNIHAQAVQIGRYDGEATNTTFNQKSNVRLMLKTIDAAGRVTGYFGVVQGTLIGKGDLTGNIDENGVLRLSGPFASWQIVITARINGNTIQANYNLTGADTQNGVFTVTLAADINEQPIKPKDPAPPSTDQGQACTKLEGNGYNNTYHQAGNISFDILSKDASGNVSVKFRAYNGLLGEGILTGKADSNGIIRFRGNISGSNIEIALHGNADGSLSGDYVLTSGGTKQDGTISVKCTQTTATTTQPPVRTPPGPPKIEPPVKTTPDANYGSINGSWKGTYTCGQGLTNLVLSLFAKDGRNVEGVFTALLGDGPAMQLLASLKVKGVYDIKTGRLDLKGVDWDTKPAGYELVDLTGVVTQPNRNISGKVIHTGCTAFNVEKIKF